MAFDQVILDIASDVKIGVQDALRIFGQVAEKTPAALTGLTVLAASIEKALADASADTANPTQLILTLPGQLKDFEAIWPATKNFLATLGVK